MCIFLLGLHWATISDEWHQPEAEDCRCAGWRSKEADNSLLPHWHRDQGDHQL